MIEGKPCPQPGGDNREIPPA